jgi:uncharacterized protein involved in exopolysaccharide biosynthesis
MAERAPSSRRDAVAWSSPFRVRTRSTLWIGTVVFALGLLATGARVLATKPLYRAEALVIYEPGVLPSEDDAPREMGPHLREMLTSPPRLYGLVEELHFDEAPVARHTDVNLAHRADKLREDIRVAARDGTSFAVSYDAPDRDQAKAVLTRLVNAVVDDDTARRQQQAEAARRALDLERQKAEQDLAVKQARLADFSAKHPAAKNAAPTGDRERSADTAAEIASLQLRATELEAMLAHPASREAAGALDPAVVAGATHTADPAVVAARAKIAAQLLADERDLDEKQTRLPGQHPEIKAALRRVSDARAALRKSDAAVAASAAAADAAATPAVVKPGAGEQTTSLRRALSAVRARIAMLQRPRRSSPAAGRADAADAVAAPSAGDAAIAAELARAVSEARERRRQVEGKLFQAQLLSTLGAAGQGGGFLVSVQPSLPARPIAWRRLKVGLIGGPLSLVLGLFAFLLAGRLDGHLHDPTDVARILGPKVVVVAPKLGIKLAAREAVARGSSADG